MDRSDAIDLSGSWNGLYSYRRLGADEAFTAELSDHGGLLAGVIEEVPRLVDAGGRLHALVNGTRHGATVFFRKTYDGTGGWRHSVDYRGEVNADASEISGTWTLKGLAGTFLMVRATLLPVQAEAAREAPVLAGVRRR